MVLKIIKQKDGTYGDWRLDQVKDIKQVVKDLKQEFDGLQPLSQIKGCDSKVQDTIKTFVRVSKKKIDLHFQIK